MRNKKRNIQSTSDLSFKNFVEFIAAKRPLIQTSYLFLLMICNRHAWSQNPAKVHPKPFLKP